MEAYFARLKNNIVPVDERDRNAIARDFVDAAQTALGVPRIEGFNRGPFTEAPASSTSPTTRRATSAPAPRSPICTR